MNGYAKSNSAGPIIGIVLIFGLAYAVLRYPSGRVRKTRTSNRIN